MAARAVGKAGNVAAQTAEELRTRLKIKKQIGKGAFATVFSGTYDDTAVAVKVLHPEFAQPSHVQTRMLLQEGQLLMKDLGEGIVRCLAICQIPADFPGLPPGRYSQPTWALVMEYVGGGTLAKMIMKQMTEVGTQVFTDHDAFHWLIDIAGALAALHSLSPPVIHRDLKQENILLTPDLARAKLVDFGLHVTLDTLNRQTMLRRRSLAKSEGVGRTSVTSIASLAAASVSSVAPLTPGAGGAANPASVTGLPSGVPSSSHSMHSTTGQADAATGITDATGARIFYLLDELPQHIAASAAASGPASRTGSRPASRRPSFNEPPSSASVNAPLSGRGSGAVGGGAGSGPAGSSAPTSTDGIGAGRRLLVPLPGGGGVGQSRPTNLVPLNEEASYHGNAAAFSALHNVMSQMTPPAPGAAGAAGATHAAAAAVAAHADELRLQLGIACDTPPAALVNGGGSIISPRSGNNSSSSISSNLVLSGGPAGGVPTTTSSNGANAISLLKANQQYQPQPQLQMLSGVSASGDGAIAAAVGAVGHITEDDVDFSMQHVYGGGEGGGGTSTRPGSAAPSRPGSAVNVRLATCPGGINGISAGGALGFSSAPQHINSNNTNISMPASPALGRTPSGRRDGAVAAAWMSPRDSRPSMDHSQPHHSHSQGPASATGFATVGAVVSNRPQSASAHGSFTQGQQGHGAVRRSVSRRNTDTEVDPILAPAVRLVSPDHGISDTSPVPAVAVTTATATATGTSPSAAGGSGTSASDTYDRSMGPGPALPRNSLSNSRRALLLSPNCTTASVNAAGSVSISGEAVPGIEAAAGNAAGAAASASGQPPGRRSMQYQISVGAAASGTATGTGTGAATPVSPGLDGTSGGNAFGAGGASSTSGRGYSSLAKQSMGTVLTAQYERDFQWVFRLTGQTGSGMYMSPEVFKAQPYNEKADVFSFGVVMYELFARTLLLLTRVGNAPGAALTAEEYAARVAKGYRPDKPKAMAPEVWDLVCRCWHEDPCERPTMAEVVEELEDLQRMLAPTNKQAAACAKCAIQ